MARRRERARRSAFVPGWRKTVAGLAVLGLAWQGAQVLTAGNVGVPGLIVIPVAPAEEPRGRKSSRYWVGGITTVEKSSQSGEAGPAADPATTASLPVPALPPMQSSGPAASFAGDAPTQAAEPAFEPVLAPEPGETAAQAADAGVPVPSANPARGEPVRTEARSAIADAAGASDASPPAGGGARDAASLPWRADAADPPTESASRTRVAALPPATRPAAPPPSRRELSTWIKSRANEFVGGVDDQGMPLYRFDVWLDPPAPIRERIAAVAYEYDAPSARPRAQTSRDRASGFLVKFGGASCARTVSVTVTLDDGSTQDVEVNGCTILM